MLVICVCVGLDSLGRCPGRVRASFRGRVDVFLYRLGVDWIRVHSFVKRWLVKGRMRIAMEVCEVVFVATRLGLGMA